MIKEPFLIAMRYDPKIREKLADDNKVAPTTIQDWIRENNPILTTIKNLDIIKKHFGLLEAKEILEQDTTEPAKI
jgi:hypothetical protein